MDYWDRAGDHQPAAREAVGDVPRERRHQKPGKRLNDDGPRDHFPAVGQVQQQVINS